MPRKRKPGAAGDGSRAHRVAGQRFDNTQPVSDQTLLRQLQRQRQVEAVHRLGARALAELLDEIARYHGIAADIDRRLAAFSMLDPEILRAIGGDRFAAAPLHVVRPDG
jgi:hypothetical protein